MEDQIVNRVVNSKLVTIDLQDYYPDVKFEIIDLKDILFKGLILRELDFRIWVKEKDWSSYQGKSVLIQCSADAIIPQWVNMIITSKLSEVATYVGIGSIPENLEYLHLENIKKSIVPEDYFEVPVVIKGCFDKPVSERAYILITSLLSPYVKSLMYGEPCSTVPVYKAHKK